MAYRFVSFAGVTLPIYNTQADWSGGAAPSTLVRTLSGSYDVRQTLRAIPEKAVFTLRGIVATGEDSVLVQVNALRALIGTRGALIREPRGGGDDQTTTARLLTVNLVVGRTPAAFEEINMTFEAASPYWQGESKTANRADGVIVATNEGNAPVRDAVLTVVGEITSGGVTVTGPGLSWEWDSTLGAGLNLVVSGNQATANAVATTVTINDGQTRDVLIELEPGETTLTVTGGASASLAWYDAWQ